MVMVGLGDLLVGGHCISGSAGGIGRTMYQDTPANQKISLICLDVTIDGSPQAGTNLKVGGRGAEDCPTGSCSTCPWSRDHQA